MGFLSKIFNIIKSKVPQPPQPIEEKPVEVVAPVVVDPIAYRFKVKQEGYKILTCNDNSQRNNKYSPKSACNVTSLQIAMSIDYPNLTDDQLFVLANSESTRKIVHTKYPGNAWIDNYFRDNCANEVFVCIIEAANQIIGSSAYCKMVSNLSLQDIKNQIDNGYAVMLCGKYAGNGHFICVVGYNDIKKCFIVNDPWGNWIKGYTPPYDGFNVEYPYDRTMQTKSSLSILVHSDKRIPV